MAKVSARVTEFLSAGRIAVAGVSRDSKQPANLIYRKLKTAAHEVFSVNPNAAQVEGGPCYPDLRSIPESIEAVVIATHPSVSVQVVRECVDLGIPRLWLHRSFGEGSVSDEAVRACKEGGIDCIVGGCPMMYCEPVDFGHRCMKWLLKLNNRVP